MTGASWRPLKAGSVSAFLMMPSRSTGPLAPMPTPRSPGPAAAMAPASASSAWAALTGVGLVC